jgi:hypothetical protein
MRHTFSNSCTCTYVCIHTWASVIGGQCITFSGSLELEEDVQVIENVHTWASVIGGQCVTFCGSQNARFIFLPTSMLLSVHVYVCMCVCLCACMFVCMYLCIHNSTFSRSLFYVFMYTCIHKRACVLCVCVCMRVSTYVYMYLRIYYSSERRH